MIATSWPTAIIWVAVIMCFVGIPIAMSGTRRSPFSAELAQRLAEQQRETLSELTSMRQELAALRTEVAELDRVLKSVE